MDKANDEPVMLGVLVTYLFLLVTVYLSTLMNPMLLDLVGTEMWAVSVTR